MATPFNQVYDIFFSNIHSYKLALLEETSLEEELTQWLENGIAHFTMARTDIYNFNVQLQEFNCDLTYLEKHILGKCMVLEYMNTHLMDEKNLSTALNSRDYRTYSPAKQLEALIKVQDHLIYDRDTLMSKYSYSGDILELFGKKQ